MCTTFGLRMFSGCVFDEIYSELFSSLHFLRVFKHFLSVCLKLFKPLIYRTKTTKWTLKDSKPSRERGGAVLVGHSCQMYIPHTFYTVSLGHIHQVGGGQSRQIFWKFILIYDIYVCQFHIQFVVNIFSLGTFA